MKNGKLKWSQASAIFLFCIVINWGGRFLAERLQLPVWMDMIGTCIACYYLGLWLGILVAVLNNVLFSGIAVSAVVYALTGVVCAAVMHFCIQKGFMEKLHMAMFMSFWIGLSSVVVSTPLNLIFHHGYSGNLWGDALFDMMKWYGFSDFSASLLGEIVVEVLDKQICILFSIALIRFAKQISKKRGTVKAASGVSAVLILSLALPLFISRPVYAGDPDISEQSMYAGRIFNNQNGLMSSEANVIAETPDGYIWIGSYAGLTRYDGEEFEFITEGGIVNVTDMLCDSKGRLWVGTNDRGIARYEEGEFIYFKTEDGLPASSVRSFCEGNNGEVYVATTDRICVFDENDNLSVYNENVFYMQQLAMYNDMLVCIGNDGGIYALKDGRLIASYQNNTDATFFSCVEATSNGLYGGTISDLLYRIEIENGKITIGKGINLPIQNMHYIEEKENGKIWLCGDNGFGYYTDGKFHEWDLPGFSSSLECVFLDYQENIWLASSRTGVACLSRTPFSNIFEESGIPSAVCNATTAYQGGCAVGTDSGLIMIDRTGNSVENELTELLAGDRVRCVMQDGDENLWICTYSEHGLVQYTKDGDIKSYTSEQFPIIPSDRVRCITQLSDGSIAVGTADGIYYIDNGEVTGAITQKDGLVNSQILSLVEGNDGVLYAGSDGAGLFFIRDGSITDNLSTQTGLPSDVILRVVPAKEGILLVTSNSLCLVGDEIKTLTQFPYYNNYDVLFYDDMAYVLSSAGIFTVSCKELFENADMTYTLYDARHGLRSALTANSWNYFGEDGSLYACCNEGVLRFTADNSADMEYRFGLKSVVCDNEEIVLKNNEGVIPGTAKDVTITASLRNYALSDAKVRFFLEGEETDKTPVSYAQIKPIRIISPTSGEYTVHFQVYDRSGKQLVEEQVFTLKKDQQMWEKGWYRFYLLFMVFEIACYIIWTFVLVLDDRRRRKSDLEQEKRKHQELVLSQTVLALAKTVDAKDNYTRGHSVRVAEYASLIAQRMGKTEEEQAQIYRAGILHDIGKIRVPEEIINKPGKLTADEFAMIKLHPITGYHILKGISADENLSDGARFHHERYDGNGYPNGLEGNQIPEIARIICVADAYDAMASNRSYRNALPQDVIRDEIECGRGTQFDPEIADIMLQIIAEDTEYQMKETAVSKKKILVVDDEAICIQVVETALQSMDIYELDSAQSGEEAIELLKEKEFDLVLLDYRMPEMDGIETAEKIREFSEIPIVFMSSDKLSLESPEIKNINISDYITKPFVPATLLEILHIILVR